MTKAIPEGEPNFWFLTKKDNWCMRIQFNGEMNIPQQQKIVGKIIKLLK